MSLTIYQGGIAFREGLLLCSCCETQLGELRFGTPANCNCSTVKCYNPNAEPPNPSPPFLMYGTSQVNNESPGSDRFATGITYYQGPVYNNNFTEILGWTNLVTRPTLVRLVGSIGGDVALWHFLSIGSLGEYNGYSLPASIVNNFNSTLRLNGTIPNQGEFPCGICDTPRNGAHQVNYAFVLVPNSYFGIQAVSFLECAPYYSLSVRRLSPYTPP